MGHSAGIPRDATSAEPHGFRADGNTQVITHFLYMKCQGAVLCFAGTLFNRVTPTTPIHVDYKWGVHVTEELYASTQVYHNPSQT